MTQAKITLNDIHPVVFNQEQLEYFRKLKQLYEQDILLINPLQYNPAPVWSQLHVHMAELKSQADIFEMLLTQGEDYARELTENLKEEAKAHLHDEPVPELTDPHRYKPI